MSAVRRIQILVHCAAQPWSHLRRGEPSCSDLVSKWEGGSEKMKLWCEGRERERESRRPKPSDTCRSYISLMLIRTLS